MVATNNCDSFLYYWLEVTEMMDLNIHSRFSTGSKSVEEIIDTSKSRGIEAISITDLFSVDSIKDIKQKGFMST